MRPSHEPLAGESLFVEPLEPRIAPAALDPNSFASITVGTPQHIAAGQPGVPQGLSTGPNGTGALLVYVSAGEAVVYTTDLNGDRQFDYNEITGIAAGPGLQLTAFADIHGDIVTNLVPNSGGDLTDSDNNPTNGRDGLVLLPSSIVRVELRSLVATDLDSNVPGNTVANRQGPTSHSIFGNIYAGGDFGSAGNGLFITNGGAGAIPGSTPSVGSILVGTAAGSQHFSFGNSLNPSGFKPLSPGQLNPDIGGDLQTFTPAAGAHGADITGVHSTNNVAFAIGTLATGNGGDGGAGTGARGGDFREIALSGDLGTYQLLAGDGGQGANGGRGGSIVGFVDVGTIAGQTILHSGRGGQGVLGAGGDGGTVTFTQANTTANVQVFLGDGGDGLTAGGNAANQPTAVFTPPSGQTPTGDKVVATMRDPYIFTSATTGQLTYNPQPSDRLLLATDPVTGFATPQHEFTNGTVRPIDFDGDGYFDLVFTTSQPEQIVVLFGGDPLTNPNVVNVNGIPGAFDQSKTLFLDAPLNTQAITVGDFNADGRPDIAVASAGVGNTGGVTVFLNQIRDLTRNPNFTPGFGVDPRTNFARNPLGDHPFSVGLHTATPAPTFTNDTTLPIRALVAGDYNGDGVMDLAYVSSYLTTQGEREFVNVLFGDTNRQQPYGSGFFLANPALSTELARNQYAANIGEDLTQNPILNAGRAAATGSSPTHDQVFVGRFGQSSIFQLDPIPGRDARPPSALLFSAGIGTGVVDTARSNETSLQTPTLQDFTLQDINGDGNADVVFLSNAPAQYVTIQQNTGTFGQFVLTTGTGSQAGAKVATNGGVFGVTALLRGIRAVDFSTTVPAPGTSAATPVTDVAFLDIGGYPDGFDRIQQGRLSLAPSDAAVAGLGTLVTDAMGKNETVLSFDPYRPAAGAYRQYGLFNPSNGTVGGDYLDFVRTDPTLGTLRAPFEFQSVLDRPSFLSSDNTSGFGRLQAAGQIAGIAATLTDNGVRVFGGSGGDSVIGPGGQGGSIGQTLTATVGPNGAVGSVSVIVPAFPSYNGVLDFVGGNGGQGFQTGSGVSTAGGNGGDVAGVSVRGGVVQNDQATTQSALRAGDGGIGVNGPAGRGGDIAKDSILNGAIFTAGDGGNGLQGGRGGNLAGNGLGGTIYDTQTETFVGNAGSGGQGSLAGGDGGAITDFRPQVTILGLITAAPADLIYNDKVPVPGFTQGLNPGAGDGGSAAGGAGGRGGQVLNSGPDSTANAIAGTIYVTAGNGGDGLRGGGGGQINNFINAPSARFTSAGTPITPSFFNFLGGDGGQGIVDLGGNGGNVLNVSVNAVGNIINNSFLGLRGNRIISGAGGDSFALDGGTGGMITNVTATSVSTPLAVASGVGGSGLTAGQAGGAITNNVFNAAGTSLRFGKLLVIAGAGGDGYAVLPTDVIAPGDPVVPGQPVSLNRLAMSFGGVAATGGNGGSIVGLTQPASIQTNVDLIAGNGGSTINYGTSLDANPKVGRGGSVMNITVAGDIGTITRDATTNITPAIKAYNDLDNDGKLDLSLAQYVATYLRPGSVVLDNFSATGGNVGIVAGAAGSVAAIGGVPQPASGASNGVVQTVTARNIMSIVAGSVDAVAPVDNVTGLRLTSQDRILGADKRPTPPGVLNPPADAAPDSLVEFADLTGRIVTDLQPGFRLIDGAIFASANTTGDLANQFGNPRVVIQP